MIETFAQRLIELRREKKLSQRAFAKIMSVSQPAIALWEQGKRSPDMDTVLKLADYFEVTTDYLLGRES